MLLILERGQLGEPFPRFVFGASLNESTRTRLTSHWTTFGFLGKRHEIRLMVQKSCYPVEVSSFSHYLQGFPHPRWWSPDFWTITSIILFEPSIHPIFPPYFHFPTWRMNKSTPKKKEFLVSLRHQPGETEAFRRRNSQQKMHLFSEKWNPAKKPARECFERTWSKCVPFHFLA